MPRKKNNFLNAKPVSKVGGKTGGVRNPSKPYAKPSASSKPKPKPAPKATGTSGKPVQMGANKWPKGSGSWA